MTMTQSEENEMKGMRIRENQKKEKKKCRPKTT